MKTSRPTLEEIVERAIAELDQIAPRIDETAAAVNHVLDVILHHQPALAPQFTLLKESLLHARHLAAHVSPPAREALLALSPEQERRRLGRNPARRRPDY